MCTGSPNDEHPILRALEAHHVDGDRPGLVLVDPLGLIDGQVFVPWAMVPLLERLDGRRTIVGIQDSLREAGHRQLAEATPRLLRDLDESLVMDSARFHTTLEHTIDEFVGGAARAPHHAGSAGYPAGSADCRAVLAASLGAAPATLGPTPRGLVAPHIDLQRGAAGYGAAYRALAVRQPADLYVVFGTGHQGPSAPVTGLAQDWATPIGTLATATGFVAAVHRRLGQPTPLDVFMHRSEHSLEFQMLHLRHLLDAAGHDAKVAGFLCGALPSATGNPDQERYVDEIVAAFRSAADEFDGSVCFVAGADLAHVGPSFGDRDGVDDERRRRLERDDRSRLAALEQGAPGRFHAAVVEDGNRDRVCSATALYLTARLTGVAMELIDYRQAVSDDGSTCVSFCAGIFG